MKKWIAWALALVAALCMSTGVLAAGKIEVSQDCAYALASGESVYGYLYAQVANTGDKPIEYSDGLFELYDADGEVLASESYLYCCPKVLQPGETGYLFASSVRVENAAAPADVADYSVSVTGKGKGNHVVTRVPATARVETVEDKYSKEISMYVTVTNDTDKTLYDLNVAAAILDGEGKVVYVNSDSTYNIGIPAGGSAEVRINVTGAVVEYFTQNGFTAENVDCIAYTEEYVY
jgi:copper(I)-binding protein